MYWRGALMAVLAWILAIPRALGEENPPLNEQYLHVYLKLNDAEGLQKQHDYRGALTLFEDCYTKFVKIYQEHAADWEPALLLKRIQDCRARIEELQRLIAASLPPGETPAPADNFAFVDFAPDAPATYPWRKDVAITEFWVGEPGSGPSSAWDDNWQKNYGGADSPGHRQGYLPAGHAPKVNPFYVALPFNDLAYPDLAKQWLPKGWKAPQGARGRPVSACKDRWVEIKNESGDICYAQWEDVGPGGGDNPDYVFGDGRPKNGMAGIDVSPAVAKYLHLQPEGDGRRISWRFVDAEAVPPGYWLKYDEEAILYSAMNAQGR
jgi:hypothetical protein